MMYLPLKQTWMQKLLLFGQWIWHTWTIRCIYTYKSYFFKIQNRVKKIEKPIAARSTFYIKKTCMQYLVSIADKYDTNKLLDAYTLITAIFSNFKHELKMKKKNENFEKPIAARSTYYLNKLVCKTLYRLNDKYDAKEYSGAYTPVNANFSKSTFGLKKLIAAWRISRINKLVYKIL